MAHKKRKGLIAILGLIFVLVLTCTVLSFGNAIDTDAYNSSSAVPASIGSLTYSDYSTRTDGAVFDRAVLDSLYSRITGNTSATYNDLYSLVAGSTSTVTGTVTDASKADDVQSYSMNFQKINQAGGSPITVEFGGFKWNVVYLTTNTTGSTGGNGNLIATLWMSENVKNGASDLLVQYNGYSDETSSNNFPSSMYSTSKVRVDTLNAGGDAGVAYATGTSTRSTYPSNRNSHRFAQFTMSKSAIGAKSLTDYLVAPKNLIYQQRINAVWAVNNGDFHLSANDAWGLGNEGPDTTVKTIANGNSGWFEGEAISGGRKNDMRQLIAKTQYNEWINDLLWLPSTVETGWYEKATNLITSLWGISSQHAIVKASNNYWGRSADYNNCSYAFGVTAAGGYLDEKTNTNQGVRPALHLNLTLADKNAVVYDNPTDITTPIVYDGDVKTPESLASNSSTKPSWWNTDFTDTTKFKFEYYDSTNTKVSEMRNAGNYWVKLSFLSGVDGIFDGGSDTSDSAHIETTRERWFKFNISKKPIEVDFDTDSNGYKTAKAKNQSDITVTNCPSDRQPSFGVNYTSSDGKGYTFNNPDVPNKVGSYTVTAVITNSSTCNFIIDTTKTHTTSYSKGKTKVTKPTIMLPASENIYNNVDYEYIVSGYDNTLMNMTLPSDVSYNSNRVKIRNAGTYEIKFELKTPAEYCWDGTNPEDPVKYSITVQQKEISVTGFEALLESDSIKNADVAKVPDDNILGKASGDVPEVLIMFGLQDDSVSEFNVYPNVLGKYKARLALSTASAKNYKLDAATAALSVNFDVTGDVTLLESHLVWRAKPNAGGDYVYFTSTKELPFIIGGYTVSIDDITLDKDYLRAKGVKIYTDDTTNGYSGDVQKTDVGNNYSASVRLVNYDDSVTAYDQTFTLNWKIVPHKATKPSYSGEDLMFSKNADDYDLVKLYGMDSDWADYVEFEIEKDWSGDKFGTPTISDVGTYIITIKIKSDMSKNVVWSDLTPLPVQQTLKIIPRTVEIKSWENTTGIPSPLTENSDDLDYLDYVYTKQDGTPATYNDVIASPNTTFNIKAVSKYGENVIISTVANVEDNETFSTPGNAAEPPTLVAKPTFVEESKEYTGDELTFELNGFDGTKMILNGMLTATEVGEYSVTISFRDGLNYCWDDNTRNPITLKFYVTEQAEQPAPPAPPVEKEPNFFEKLLANNFPLWQVGVMAVSALLAIIFLIKAVQYGNRASKAKGEAKKISSKAYAALLPIFDATVVYGLSNKLWSIIAFATVGLALLMFVVALIMRSSCKKAELAKETAKEEFEQRKYQAQENALQEKITHISLASAGNDNSKTIIEEMRREMAEREERYRREEEDRRRQEEERRRQEEDRRRDDEDRHRQEMDAMKMMFANMLGRQQMDNIGFDYASVDDTDLLVQKVIAGLLPVVQQMVPEQTAYLSAPAYEKDDRYDSLLSKIDDLEQQLATVSATHTTTTVYIERDPEDEDFDFDDEEEWDSILDEDEEDNFVESVIIEADGTVSKAYPNFRMRLKQSSEKNREWYAVIKNMFCSQKGVTYRVYKRVEKIRYQGQVIGVIGIAKRSIKLWLALKPYEYDARRYHHKDVSDKPRFVDVPMYVRVGSDRALERAQELILALFQDLNMEARKRYNDRDIQELIFTMKHNRLLTNKENKKLLCEVMHVHDCDVLDDETAQKCIESKNVDFIDDNVIETVKLDDIDAHFQDGNRVTLEKLRKAGLVSEECTGVNIVADKRLTKPLIIVANDFSLTAVKLIVLTGGRAIKLNKV